MQADAACAGALSNAWEMVGGGPADLFFPDEFLGRWIVRPLPTYLLLMYKPVPLTMPCTAHRRWYRQAPCGLCDVVACTCIMKRDVAQVQSTLVNVELPLGKQAVPDMASVDRAITRDLNQFLSYPVTFVRNASGKVVMDRRRNTADLLGMYYPNISIQQLGDMVTWDIDNPNDLQLMLPNGGEVCVVLCLNPALALCWTGPIYVLTYSKQWSSLPVNIAVGCCGVVFGWSCAHGKQLQYFKQTHSGHVCRWAQE